MELTPQWLAGFFDGEGYIGVAWNKTRRSFYPRATVSNTHLPTLKVIQAQFGGSLHRSYGPNGKNQRKCYSLHWGHKSVRQLLETIAPYLVTKKEQAELLLANWNWDKPNWVHLTDEQRDQRVRLASDLHELKGKRFEMEVYSN